MRPIYTIAIKTLIPYRSFISQGRSKMATAGTKRRDSAALERTGPVKKKPKIEPVSSVINIYVNILVLLPAFVHCRLKLESLICCRVQNHQSKQRTQII